jgi:hypothetical protein
MTTASDGRIDVRLDDRPQGRIATLVLDNPAKLNALGSEGVNGLSDPSRGPGAEVGHAGALGARPAALPTISPQRGRQQRPGATRLGEDRHDVAKPQRRALGRLGGFLAPACALGDR